MNPEERNAWLVLVVCGAIPWLAFSIAWQIGFRPFPRQRNRSVPWGMTEVFILIVGFFVALPAILGKIWKTFDPNFADDLRSLLLLTMLSSIVTLIGVPALLRLLCGARFYQVGLVDSYWIRHAWIGVVFYLLSIPFVAIAFLAANVFFQPTPHKIEQMVRESPTTGTFALAWISAVLIAPFHEELLFRGILLSWLRRGFGPWPGIIASSLVFALLHSDAWPAPIPLFVLALFLGYLAYRTSSLAAPIALHATFNGVSMLMLMASMGRNN